METQDVVLQKKRLRAELRATLGALAPADRRAYSQSACARLVALPQFLSANVILAYRALPTECDPQYAVMLAQQLGKRVAFPLCAPGRQLTLYLPDCEDAFLRGNYGIWEPDPARSRLIASDELDLIVVPGLAYDRNSKSRLGQGGGYYDRLLQHTNAYCCGFCFDVQLLDDLPAEAHDRAVNCIVTPSGVF